MAATFSILTLLVATLSTQAVADASAERQPKRVYVLHSGMHIYWSHPWKNHAAEVLRDALVKRKVPAEHIVVLDNPFPSASFRNMVPREGVAMFLDSMKPDSDFSQQAYLRLHKALQAHGVGPKDEIVWIGHSAGGQIGLTMAYLSETLERHPKLKDAAQSYRFHTIATLGTPVGGNHVPDKVEVRHHYSPQDKVVRLVCDGAPWILQSLGVGHKIAPCVTPLDDNCRVHCWYGIDHPYWIWEDRVIDCILNEANGARPSPWNTPTAALQPGMHLPQLISRLLAESAGVVVEELPGDQ